jgi:hypothetical protein
LNYYYILAADEETARCKSYTQFVCTYDTDPGWYVINKINTHVYKDSSVCSAAQAIVFVISSLLAVSPKSKSTTVPHLPLTATKAHRRNTVRYCVSKRDIALFVVARGPAER